LQKSSLAEELPGKDRKESERGVFRELKLYLGILGVAIVNDEEKLCSQRTTSKTGESVMVPGLTSTVPHFYPGLHPCGFPCVICSYPKCFDG
jgi:hypothetical protein